MDYYREAQILVYPYNPYSPTDKPIKVTTTIIFEHQEEQAKAKAFLKGVYGWTEGVHYAALEVKTARRFLFEERTHIDRATDQGDTGCRLDDLGNISSRA